MRNLESRSTWSRLAALLLLLAVTTGLGLQPARAAGVVGDGTPTSCTEAALNTALMGGGLVTFDCGPAPHVIILTIMKQITADTEIDGGGLVTLSGGNSVPHFQVFTDTTLTLRDLTLSRGSGTYGSIENFGTLNLINSQLTDNTASVAGGAVQNFGVLNLETAVISNNEAGDEGGGLFIGSGVATIVNSQIFSNTVNGGSGGGIWNDASLAITNTTITDNGMNGAAGGILNRGTLNMTQVLLQGNRAGGFYDGGGLLHAAGTAVLEQVTFLDNSATTGGGGISVLDGSVTINESLFTGNQANFGAAISNSGTFTLTNSLVYSNTATNLIGGIYNTNENASALFINVTVSENAATNQIKATGVHSDGGSLEMIFSTVANNFGYGIGRLDNASQLTIKNTIVAGNTTGDCMNSITSEGFNIASNSLNCGLFQVSDQPGANPLLGPLADNGGPTLTYLPLSGSPAIDEGLCVFGIDSDQRGQPRPFGEACDVGAVEAGPPPLLPVYLPLLGR